MAEYRDVTEWHSEKAIKTGRVQQLEGDVPGLFDDPEARRRVAELISRAALRNLRR